MCDGHTHQAVDNTPNCSNCTDGCSSCQATCASGLTYSPTVSYDVNQHRKRTCRYDTCGQTWQKCVSSAPICNDPWRIARIKTVGQEISKVVYLTEY